MLSPFIGRNYKKYVKYLKLKYRQKKITGGNKTISYINLAVVRKDDDKSQMHKCAKAVIHGDVDYVLENIKQSLELSEVGQLEDGSLARCVLVQGDAGIGKTTLAWELCKQWEQHNLLRQYSLLVLLTLRDKTVQKAEVAAELFFHPNPSVSSDVVSIVNNGEGTAFLLDGFDELPQEKQDNSIFVDLITKEIFPDACVIVTSRPSVSDILCKHCSEQNYQHVEVLGFTGEQRNSFVEAWFDENVEESSRADELVEFKQYLDLHPQIRALMYIPLSCSIVLGVYQSSKAWNDVPKTQTELYIHNTLATLSRYLNKKDGKQTWMLKRMKDIPQEEQEKLEKLSKVAYDGIVHQPHKVVFQEEEIPQDLIKDKEAMGFLHVDDDTFRSDSYNFLHLTIQEFLAAYYISTLEPSEQIQRIEDSLDKRHLEIMLRFFAGITKFKSSDGSRIPIEWLQTYYKPGNKLECLRWMFEARDQGLIRQVLGNGTQDLNLLSGTLAPFDCYVLGYCITNSDCQWILVCTLEEEGMKMLSRGSNGCLCNVQVLYLISSDLEAGVTHLGN